MLLSHMGTHVYLHLYTCGSSLDTCLLDDWYLCAMHRLCQSQGVVNAAHAGLWCAAVRSVCSAPEGTATRERREPALGCRGGGEPGARAGRGGGRGRVEPGASFPPGAG